MALAKRNHESNENPSPSHTPLEKLAADGVEGRERGPLSIDKTQTQQTTGRRLFETDLGQLEGKMDG